MNDLITKICNELYRHVGQDLYLSSQYLPLSFALSDFRDEEILILMSEELSAIKES